MLGDISEQRDSVKTTPTYSWGSRISWTHLMSKYPIRDSVQDPWSRSPAWWPGFRGHRRQQQALRCYILISVPRMKRTLRKDWRVLESVGEIFISEPSISLALETSEGPLCMIWVYFHQLPSCNYEIARGEVFWVNITKGEAEDIFCPFLVHATSGRMPAV